MKEKRPEWSSNIVFILAAVGSAVGLGNIWRFPYIMGQNGGAVFLFVYLALILTICFVPLCCELFLGKTTKQENISAYETVNPKLRFLGWSNVLTGILISAFYFVVGGWILNYIWQNLIGYQIRDYATYFTHFSSEGLMSSALTFLFIFAVCFFVARGVNKGIEVANKIMMPIFAVILVFLAIFSLNLPNAYLGLEFMFKPDLSKISPQMFLAALGQALFTLSIGMGAIMVYGSYMRKKDNIVKSAYAIIASDTIFALLAGIMIFPAVFAFGLEPDSGAGLVFITLPKIFAQINGGRFIAILFFVLLLFAALTSGISMIEVPVAAFMERFRFSRIKSTALTGALVALLSVPAALSFGILSDFTIFGKTVFALLDYATSNFLLPLNTLAVCITMGWIFKIKKDDIFNNGFVNTVFNFTLKFILPAVLVGLIIFGIMG